MVARPRYFEDFEAGRSYALGTVTVSEQEIIAFARQFDPLPIHTDPVAVREGPFGGLVASGWHTGSLFMRLFVGGLIGEAANLGSPGVEELRFLAPVRPGYSLTGRYRVERCEPSRTRAERGTVHGVGELLNDADEAVFRIRNRSFFRRRTGAGADAERFSTTETKG